MKKKRGKLHPNLPLVISSFFFLKKKKLFRSLRSSLRSYSSRSHNKIIIPSRHWHRIISTAPSRHQFRRLHKRHTQERGREKWKGVGHRSSHSLIALTLYT